MASNPSKKKADKEFKPDLLTSEIRADVPAKYQKFVIFENMIENIQNHENESILNYVINTFPIEEISYCMGMIAKISIKHSLSFEKFIQLFEAITEATNAKIHPNLLVAFSSVFTKRLYFDGIVTDDDLIFIYDNLEAINYAVFCKVFGKNKNFSEGFSEDMVNYHYEKDTIEYFIKYDDVDSLSVLLSSKTNEIYEEKLQINRFDINKVTKKVIPINFAVYYGSIKCYKYLLLNMSDKGALNSDSFYLAVAGGNNEIIHSFEHMGIKPNDKALYTAANFFRYDMFDYFILNYDLKLPSYFDICTELDTLMTLYYIKEGITPTLFDPDCHLSSVHIHALYSNYTQLMILLDNGGDPNQTKEVAQVPFTYFFL